MPRSRHFGAFFILSVFKYLPQLFPRSWLRILVRVAHSDSIFSIEAPMESVSLTSAIREYKKIGSNSEFPMGFITIMTAGAFFITCNV